MKCTGCGDFVEPDAVCRTCGLWQRPEGQAARQPSARSLALGMLPLANAIDRLAAAVEAHTALTARDVEMDEQQHKEQDAARADYEQSEARRRAALRLLFKDVVMPVVERFMSKGGMEMIQNILTGHGEKGKPS